MDFIRYTQGSGDPIRVVGVIDRNGQAIDFSGAAIRAQARYGIGWPLLAAWSSTAGGVVLSATGGDGEITLDVPIDTSRAWTFAGDTVLLHIEATLPDLPRIARFPARMYLDPRLIRESE